MKAAGKHLVSPVVMLAAWVAVFSWWTLGFSAFTTFSYTLEAAGTLPRPAPTFRIRDQFGVVHDTAEFGGRHMLLQFAYLSCGDVCPMSMAESHRLYTMLSPGMRDKLQLLTVSFDPGRDTTARLNDVWRHFGEPAGWALAALETPPDDRVMADLRYLGVWVSRRTDGLFNHFAGTFLIDPHGRVVEVFGSPGNAGEIIAAVERRLL